MLVKELKRILVRLNKVPKSKLGFMDDILVKDGFMHRFNPMVSKSIYTGIEGEFLIDPVLLKNLLGNFKPKDNIGFAFSEHKMELEISDGVKTIKFKTEKPKDFPDLDKVKSTTLCRLSVQDSDNVIEAANLTSDDDLHPVLASVCIDRNIVATNSHFIKIYELVNYSPKQILLPRKSIKVLESEEYVVSLSKDKKSAIFESQDSSISILLTEGEFPKWKNVIPEGFGFDYSVNKAELLNALKIGFSLLEKNDKETAKAILTFDNGLLNLSIGNRWNEKKYGQSIDYSSTFTNYQIGFNLKHLIQIINSLKDEDIEFHFNGNWTIVKLNYNSYLMPTKI